MHASFFPGHRDMCIFNCDYLTIFQYVKKYGNVLRLEFGYLSSVVITGLPLIKEALVHKDQNFVDRPVMPIRERIFKNCGKFLDQCKMYMFYILKV